MAVDYLVQAAGTVSQVRCQGVETYTKRRKYIKASLHLGGEGYT